MKAKVDKEFLVKNLFWILIGSVGVMELIVLCVLLFGGGDIAKVEKEYTDAQKNLSSTKNGKVVNEKFLPSWKKRQDEYRAKKNDVWGKAWEAQNLDPVTKKEALVMTWPPFEASGRQAQLEMAHFGDDIEAAICGQYRNGYRDQFYIDKDRPSMKRFLFPRGEPASFRFPIEGDPDRIFKPVAWRADANPTPEECWLAQEELCVRREMILLLKDALDSIGMCKPVDKAAEGKPPIPAGAKRFRNRTWEIDLIIDKGAISAKSVIRNINPTGRPQALVNDGQGTVFRVRQRGQTAELEPIRGVLLPYGDKIGGATAEFGVESKFDSIDLAQPFEVEQVFDKATSPLKRIDALEIGGLAMSHRIAPVPLVAGPASPAPKPADETTPTDPMSNPGDASGPGGMTPSGPSDSSMTPKSEDVTPQNSLVRKRYIQVNEQVRRMPVAFTVQVEQAYIQDVLTAVANSRLRIQTTQYHWQHTPVGGTEGTPGSGGPMSGGPMGGPGSNQPMRPDWGDEGRPMKGGSGGPMGGPGFPMGGPGFPMGGPGFPMGGPGSPGEQGSADTENVQRNLVELTVYGIASIYNRYPPKPPKTETQAQ